MPWNFEGRVWLKGLEGGRGQAAFEGHSRRAAVKATLPRSLAQAMDGLSGPALALVALAVEGAEWAGVSAEPEGPCSARSQGAGICVPLGCLLEGPPPAPGDVPLLPSLHPQPPASAAAPTGNWGAGPSLPGRPGLTSASVHLSVRPPRRTGPGRAGQGGVGCVVTHSSPCWAAGRAFPPSVSQLLRLVGGASGGGAGSPTPKRRGRGLAQPGAPQGAAHSLGGAGAWPGSGRLRRGLRAGQRREGGGGSLPGGQPEGAAPAWAPHLSSSGELGGRAGVCLGKRPHPLPPAPALHPFSPGAPGPSPPSRPGGWGRGGRAGPGSSPGACWRGGLARSHGQGHQHGHVRTMWAGGALGDGCCPSRDHATLGCWLGWAGARGSCQGGREREDALPVAGPSVLPWSRGRARGPPAALPAPGRRDVRLPGGSLLHSIQSLLWRLLRQAPSAWEQSAPGTWSQAVARSSGRVAKLVCEGWEETACEEGRGQGAAGRHRILSPRPGCLSAAELS